MEENIKRFMIDMGIDDYTDVSFLYQDYILECNEIITEITPLIQEPSNELQKLVHNFKGVSANLYVTSVYRHLETLDNMLKESSISSITTTQLIPYWKEILKRYKQSITEIKALFKEHGEELTLS